jgi:hypothetical protein
MSGETAANTPLEYNPLYAAFVMLSRNLSPYDLNPFNYNPLRDLLTELIDFKRLRAQNSFEVTICATNVRTARRAEASAGEVGSRRGDQQLDRAAVQRNPYGRFLRAGGCKRGGMCIARD